MPGGYTATCSAEAGEPKPAKSPSPNKHFSCIISIGCPSGFIGANSNNEFSEDRGWWDCCFWQQPRCFRCSFITGVTVGAAYLTVMLTVCTDTTTISAFVSSILQNSLPARRKCDFYQYLKLGEYLRKTGSWVQHSPSLQREGKLPGRNMLSCTRVSIQFEAERFSFLVIRDKAWRTATSSHSLVTWKYGYKCA